MAAGKGYKTRTHWPRLPCIEVFLWIDQESVGSSVGIRSCALVVHCLAVLKHIALACRL